MKALLPLLLLLSTSPLPGEPLTVYFGTGGSDAKGIYRSTLDKESGDLTAPELAAEIGSPGFLARHSSLPVLYAVARNAEGPCVAAYQISEDGGLAFLNAVQTGDGGGTHVAVHPSGRFLLTAQYGGGSTALFPLEENGRVMPRSLLMEHTGGSGVVDGRQDNPHPHWCGFSPDGRFAFVPDLGLDGIMIYAVEAEVPRILTHSFAVSVPGGGPRHMRFSVDGRFIYLLNELSLSVSTFEYDAEDGTAKRTSTTPSLSEAVKAEENFNSASEILVHPNGQFVYSANRGHDSVTVYQAHTESGTLEVVEVEPIRGSWPRNINLDPAGRWLLAAGAHSNTVSVFAIDPQTGKLAFQTGNVVNVPSPICIVFGDRQSGENVN